MPSPDLSRAAGRIDALPADPARALGTISSTLMLLIARCNALAEETQSLARRLRDLEAARARARGRHELVIPPRSPGRPRV